MAKGKFVVGTFTDDAKLLSAVATVNEQGLKVYDVHSPFPVHGMDDLLHLKPSRLHVGGFIYGAIGTTTAVSFMSWVNIIDWANNFGGKPQFALPAFVPIIFETTVLMAAVGMVLTFCYVSVLAPFVKKHHFSNRATDDTFVLIMECNDAQDEERLKKALRGVEAKQIKTENVEKKWWFGLYGTEK